MSHDINIQLCEDFSQWLEERDAKQDDVKKDDIGWYIVFDGKREALPEIYAELYSAIKTK